MGERKNGSQNRGKSYMTPLAKGNHKSQQKAASGSGTSGGNVSASLGCFKCEGLGHRASECKNPNLTYFKCGKLGHHAAVCKSAVLTCFNCGEQGHISTQCHKPKKVSSVVQASGKVFDLNGTEVSKS